MSSFADRLRYGRRNVAERKSWAVYHIKILASDEQAATESFDIRE